MIFSLFTYKLIPIFVLKLRKSQAKLAYLIDEFKYLFTFQKP